MLAQVSECLLEIEWSLCLGDHLTWFGESTLEHLKTRPDKWNKLKIKPQDCMPIPKKLRPQPQLIFNPLLGVVT